MTEVDVIVSDEVSDLFPLKQSQVQKYSIEVLKSSGISRCEVNIVFINDEKITDLNEKYKKRKGDCPGYSNKSFNHRSIQNEDYKLIIDYNSGNSELCCIRKDRDETENIIDKEPELAAEFENVLTDIMSSAEEISLGRLSSSEYEAEEIKRLEELGYVE